MKHTLGFSVMELMVVMAIIATIVAVSTPSMIDWRQDHQLNTAARNIQASIQRLRIQAMKEKSSAEIIFDAAANKYEARVHMRGVKAGRMKVLRYHLPPGIQINKINFKNSTLRFNSRGLPAGGAGSVSLINQRGILRRIIVPITGNSRISA